MSREFSIAIFDKSEMSSELIEIYLKELEEVKEVKVFSDYIQGYDFCTAEQPDIVIVDISENQEFALDIVSKVSKSSIPVIVTSMNTSSGTIIKALRSGASEFLAKPVLKSELFGVIKKLSEPNTATDEETSKIITLFSGKGGSGKTTIAVNLALELARQTGKKTALIDLNFCLGEAAPFLNMKSSFNLSNLLENMDKISPEALPNTFEKYPNAELYFLTEPSTGESLSAVTSSRISRFFKLVKESFAYVVVDTPCAADEKIFKTLQLSDYVLYVTSVNLSAIKNTKQCLEILKEKNITDEKIKIILNRYVENDELSTQEIEQELGQSIYKKIPNNYFTVMSAINKGIAVSEENINSNVSESFRELAVMLSDSIMKNSLRTLRGNYEYQREN